jgi:hypothetical protein
VESNKEVVEAIHQLELRLNAGLALNTTALGVNNERLQNLKDAVERHATVLYGHEENDHPGMITRMAKIEQSDNERRWTLRTVTLAFVGVCVKLVYDFMSLI